MKSSKRHVILLSLIFLLRPLLAGENAGNVNFQITIAVANLRKQSFIIDNSNFAYHSSTEAEL